MHVELDKHGELGTERNEGYWLEIAVVSLSRIPHRPRLTSPDGNYVVYYVSLELGQTPIENVPPST